MDFEHALMNTHIDLCILTW